MSESGDQVHFGLHLVQRIGERLVAAATEHPLVVDEDETGTREHQQNRRGGERQGRR